MHKKAESINKQTIQRNKIYELTLRTVNDQSVEHAAFVGGNHVFDVDEGILAACLLEEF